MQYFNATRSPRLVWPTSSPAAICASSPSLRWHHAVYHCVDHLPAAHVIYEPLAKLQKEASWAPQDHPVDRYVTILLAIVQSFAIGLTLTSSSPTWSRSARRLYSDVHHHLTAALPSSCAGRADH